MNINEEELMHLSCWIGPLIRTKGFLIIPSDENGFYERNQCIPQLDSTLCRV